MEIDCTGMKENGNVKVIPGHLEMTHQQ